MNHRYARVAGYLMITAAVATNALFFALGAVFDYPDILREQPQTILTRFAAHETRIVALFAALAGCALLLLPIAAAIRGLDPTGGFAARTAFVTGAVAAVVQAIGLSRWVYAVPALADAARDPSTSAAATTVFIALHQFAGVGVGEALGYLATATWTILIATSTLRGLGHPAWLRAAGILAAALIVAGVAEPIVPATGMINFVGYILWSVWLIATGVLITRAYRGVGRTRPV